MQSVMSRIWTCVTVSISCDDNHYTTGTSKQMINIESKYYYEINETILTVYKQ